MSRLRRPIRAIREPFGTAGLVVAIVALVAALGGGAYAATNDSGGKATASAKGKQGPRGKTGKTGPAGPAGPAGLAGPKGDAGAAGSAGAAGAPGTSVKNEAEPKGANCKEGGTKLVGSATTFACNGEKGAPGAPGEPGEPWAVGNTLPSEAMETGVWRFVSHNKVVEDGEGKVSEVAEANQYVPISFPIPLAAADAEGITVKSLGTTSPPDPNCPGTAEEPKAEPGFLCVYASPFETSLFSGNPNGVYKLVASGEEEGVNTAGALLWFEVPSTPVGRHSSGSFAITAP
jgi:hypothetical protein